MSESGGSTHSGVIQEVQLEASEIEARSKIHTRGVDKIVPSIEIQGRTVLLSRALLKIASVRDEELIEGDTFWDINEVCKTLKASRLRPDILTFAQRPLSRQPEHSFKIEWENVAAVSTKSVEEWLQHGVNAATRKAVNRARRSGIAVQETSFNDEFVRGIMEIYNEIPVRQGRKFWHYGKSFVEVKRSLGDYLDRSVFLGAYLESSLIGFMKITWVDTLGVITQILSMQREFDKRPNNALLAGAVEACNRRRMTHLIYGNYVYYNPESSLTEFKRRNGFVAIEYPRYYVPLSRKGKIAVKLGLHRNVLQILPKWLVRLLWEFRKRILQGKTGRARNE